MTWRECLWKCSAAWALGQPCDCGTIIVQNDGPHGGGDPEDGLPPLEIQALLQSLQLRRALPTSYEAVALSNLLLQAELPDAVLPLSDYLLQQAESNRWAQTQGLQLRAQALQNLGETEAAQLAWQAALGNLDGLINH